MVWKTEGWFQTAFCKGFFRRHVIGGEGENTHMIRPLSIIFGFLALGEGVVYFTGIKLPGSIVGMGLLFAALHAGWVKTSWLQQLVDVLMGNLSLFLVPPCVAVMSYLDLVGRDLLSIVTATVVSTFLVMFVTGKVHEWMRRLW